MFGRNKETAWPRLGELRRQEMREWEEEFNHLAGIKPRRPGDGFAHDLITAIKLEAVSTRGKTIDYENVHITYVKT